MEILAQKRTVLGKKVKALRKEGVTPVSLFGKGMASLALQVRTTDLHRVLTTTGRNALVDLAITDAAKGSDASYKVMVRDLQINPVNDQVLHVDFYRVLMTQRMEAEVQVVLIGVAPAVDRGLGTLTHGVSAIRVDGLPGTIPSAVEVDVSPLEEANQSIFAKDIPLPSGVSLVSDPEQIVARVVVRRGMAEEEKPAEAREEEKEEKEEQGEESST